MDSKQLKLLQLEKKWRSKEMQDFLKREIREFESGLEMRRLERRIEKERWFKEADDLADYLASLKNPKNY